MIVIYKFLRVFKLYIKIEFRYNFNFFFITNSSNHLLHTKIEGTAQFVYSKIYLRPLFTFLEAKKIQMYKNFDDKS
jgi:hypothetical protein